MKSSKRVALCVVLAAASMLAGPASGQGGLAPISDGLAEQLENLTTGVIPVFVHADDIGTATEAATDAGLTVITTWDKISVAVARGDKTQIQAVRANPDVNYVEGDGGLDLFLSTSHEATGGELARTDLVDGQNGPIDGRGVAVAVIDSGVDGTHPFFQSGGSSAVKLNLKNVCGPLTDLVGSFPLPNDNCFLDLTSVNDTDTLSLGGHGTHVAGIVAGRDTNISGGPQVHGAAPGATIVSLSVGVGLNIFGANSALNWVLDHHQNPCAGCPPIKVTNNSYGPAGGGSFDSNSATTLLQRALVDEGVVTVWAAGNDGPDNSATNPPGQDPTPGIIMVASYDDLGTGTRNGNVSSFSSRGMAGNPSTYPDVSAPGSNITSACRLYLLICSTGLDPQNGPGLFDIGTFNTISGTSMATPHVAGIVAQLFQAAPDATPADIEDAIKATAYKFDDGAPYEAFGPNTTSVDKGTGLIDAYAAALSLGAFPD